MLEEFQWIFQTYPPYDVIMYILWHLCVKPEGPNVDRAWKLVDATFAMETAHREGWKWTVLRRLREKARKARESHPRPPIDGVGGGNTMNEALTNGQAAIGEPDNGFALGTGLGGALPQKMNWMPDQIDGLDRGTLIENVDIQNYEF